MKFKDDRPFATPEAAERKLLELANAVEADHAGRLALLILSSAVNVVASIVFISMLGLTGAAIATTIALIVWNVAMALFISRYLAAGCTRNVRIDTRAILGSAPQPLNALGRQKSALFVTTLFGNSAERPTVSALFSLVQAENRHR